MNSSCSFGPVVVAVVVAAGSIVAVVAAHSTAAVDTAVVASGHSMPTEVGEKDTSQFEFKLKRPSLQSSFANAPAAADCSTVGP